MSWERACERIAKSLNALDSPDQAIFYTSGRTSNEAAFLYQLFVRLFGTNNLPDCSNMCHESSGEALNEVIGVAKGSVSLEDFERADAIFVIGQNPGSNHPRMLTALQAAKRRGCRIVSINPLRERGLVRFSHPQRPLELLGAEGAPLAPPKLAAVRIDTRTCLPYSGPECGACAHACPVPGALEWEDGIRPVVNDERCTGCALCREACIVEPKAIEVAAFIPDGEMAEVP